MQDPPLFTTDGLLRGIRDILPISLFACVFSAAFGVAAPQHGLSAAETLLMSVVVFAGASQFVALDFWAPDLALIPLLLATVAVNARFILLGAALHPWMGSLPARHRYLTAAVLTDTNWAMAIQARARGERDAAVILGAGGVTWLLWIAGTYAGLVLGAALPAPERLGVDVVMVVFFTVILTGLWRGRSSLLPWLTAAVVAVVASYILPQGWHILTGGLAGGVVGALRHER